MLTLVGKAGKAQGLSPCLLCNCVNLDVNLAFMLFYISLTLLIVTFIMIYISYYY